MLNLSVVLAIPPSCDKPFRHNHGLGTSPLMQLYVLANSVE